MSAPVPVPIKKGDVKDWQTSAPSWWCPGCGDFGVLAALQRAMANLGLKNEEVVVVSGIGCSGKITGYIKSYSYHSLHGRALPPAQAIKLANKDLTVIVAGGDGDGYGIGAGHFMHAVRRNVNITYLVMDNHIYGLTKGQVSPTSDLGFVTGTSPAGSIEAPLNPLAVYLSAGGTFLAQAFSGDMKGMMNIMEEAIKHKGTSLVNIFSPCVTFNKKNTYAWYRDVLVNVQTGETEPHNIHDRLSAMEKVMSGKIYSGILYQDPTSVPYEEKVEGLKGVPLSKMDLNGFDYSKVLEEWK